MGRTLEAENRLDLDTEASIRGLCREYGITAARYFELADMNGPRNPRPMSYSTFARLMCGFPITEEHQDMMSFSLLTVRQELRRAGVENLLDELLGLSQTLTKEIVDDRVLLTKKELTTMLRVMRAAVARLT